MIVCGGLMFMDFVGYPYPWIYVLMNVLKSNELSCICLQKNQLPTKLSPNKPARFWQSMNKNYSTVFNYSQVIFSVAWLLKPALHSNSNCIQLVISSKISPCLIRYYLFDTTTKSRIWLFFGIEHVPIPNDKYFDFLVSCFDQ